jgi:hypothetical protein
MLPRRWIMMICWALVVCCAAAPTPDEMTSVIEQIVEVMIPESFF